MKRQQTLKILFLSLVVSTFTSSCGLIDKFKTPDQPTDSKAASTETKADANPDDLFSKSMDETAKETAVDAKSDAPKNVNNDDLKSLEDEFSGSGPRESQIKEVAKTEEQKKEEPKTEMAKTEEAKPIKVEEALPEIKQEVAQTSADNTNSDAGKIMSYKVHKGDTLMLIAFKIYGDPSKWKEIKQVNGEKLSANSALRANMEIKYKAPEKNFVWNPEGTPYLIKTGETLGTISNSVYQTPKKWKTIWENNKPLIKNPNVIYAGFTLYYKGSGMANYVQPKAVQKEVIASKKEEIKNPVEEIKVEKAISQIEKATVEKITDEKEIDLTKEVQASTARETTKEVKAEDFNDEALAK